LPWQLYHITGLARSICRGQLSPQRKMPEGRVRRGVRPADFGLNIYVN
jgi:hypothetical protein